MFQGQNSPKKMRKVTVLDQWVEIWREKGVTYTAVYPSNEQLIEAGKRMDPPPELIYRRFNFVNGVPEEYGWVGADAQTRKYGGVGIQRMTVETWLSLTENEQPGTHVGPTLGGNLPRPNERGGCDCPVCTMNGPMLEELGLQS